jgi:aerobic-type carbon monoxide dehydrogenase small subunit (CoxS/CutS family)
MADASGSGETVTVSLVVDGIRRVVHVPPGEPLARTLRENLGYTSVRETCGMGICGTCTILVDGRVASSCILLTAQAEGKAITTADGLRLSSGQLSEVQEAFLRARAYQCSFCIPAMTLTVHAALQDPDVGRDRDSIREYLAGNLCRCGTYPNIMAAVSDLLGAGKNAKDSGGE